MTTWSIQYGDETGSQINRTTDDIGEVHATLEHIVKDEERTAGYAGQTATWRDYDPRTEDGYGVGNWTLDIVNLDTHTPDGYTIEEAAEMQADFYGADLYLDRTDATWGELDADPLENKTESFMLEAPDPMGTVEVRANILESLFQSYSGPGNHITTYLDYLSETEAIVSVYRTLVGIVGNEWFITIKHGTADVAIKHTDGRTEWFGPMEALVYMHRVLTD